MGAAPECRRCRAVLRFVQMATGSRMPVDPIPDPAGSIAARRVPYGNGSAVYVDGYTLKPGQVAPDGWVTFRTHFASCKEPKKLRTETPNPYRTHTDFLF